MKRGALALGLLWAACSQRDGSLQGAAPSARPAHVAARPRPPSLYDAEGQLLGSGIRVAWLEVPRGFRERPKGTRADTAYEAEGIPAAHVRAFLFPQMLTGSAEELGEGVLYRGAMPADGRADAIRLDVAVLEVAPKGSIMLRITPVSYPHVAPIPEPEARKLLATEARGAE